MLGLGVAVDFQNLLGPDRRQARIYELKRYLREKIAADPIFAVKTPTENSLSAGVTTVELVGHDVVEAARILRERHRIDCRPMTTHGLNGLRISLSIFNSKDEIDLLAEVLREAAAS